MSESEKQPLVLDDVSITLNGRELIRINETVLPGEIVSVMGPSGSGKSTLLAFIAGFLDPVFSAKGDVRIGSQSILGLAPERRGVGLLFQDPLLFPHMSVERNLLFGLEPMVRSKTSRLDLVEQALATARLEGYGKADPATLSGGQRARIALMRLMLAQPRVLLLDEPFSKLDAELSGRTRDFVFREAVRNELPVLLVTHDEDDARAAGGRKFRIG